MTQNSMNIALPESMKEFVLTQVAKGGYSTASEYVRQHNSRRSKTKGRRSPRRAAFGRTKGGRHRTDDETGLARHCVSKSNHDWHENENEAHGLSHIGFPKRHCRERLSSWPTANWLGGPLFSSR